MTVIRNGKLFIHRDELVVTEADRLRDQERDEQHKLQPCSVTGQMYAGNCSECKRRVIFHCRECQQKVSGCSCTLGPKLAAIKDELHDRLFR